MLAIPYTQDTASYESGGGHFSILPGTISMYTSTKDADDAVTSSLPGQWNTSSISLQKSDEAANTESLQQAGVMSRYEESSDEQSISSDDKPLQWRIINKREDDNDDEIASPDIEELAEKGTSAQYNSMESRQGLQTGEDDTASSEDIVTRMIDEAVEGIERQEEEEGRDRFVDDNGTTFKLETEMEVKGQVEEDGSIYDDEEEEEEEEQISPSSIYHEPLQLDLLTLKFDDDSDLQSLFKEDGLQQLMDSSSHTKDHSSVPYWNPSSHSPKHFPSKLVETREAHSEKPSHAPDARIVARREDDLEAPNPRSLFAGKGVYFSGPIRDYEPVKEVRKVVKPKVDFMLEAFAEEQSDHQAPIQRRVPMSHTVKPPALQLKITDEKFSCEMPRFDVSTIEKKEERRPQQTQHQPRPILRSQFSSKMPPSEQLPERPTKNGNSVTVVNSASNRSGVKKDAPNNSSAVSFSSEPISKAQSSSILQGPTQSVVAHPHQASQASQASSSHVKTTPSAQLSVPLKKKEEGRPPHPLSQSYSANEQEEQRSLDHPRSSYIAQQLGRFKSLPTDPSQLPPLPQPSSQPQVQSDRSDREAQHPAALVQPSLAEQFNREAMYLSQDSPRNRLHSPVPSDKPYSSHNKIPTHLKEQDIDFIEEIPILIEQSALFGVRRRLVGEFSDLGYKFTKVVKRKDDQFTSMSLAEDENSSSYMLRRMTLGPEKELREREELLEAREQDLTIEALSKAEMAYVKFEVWTEARQGRWMIKGPAKEEDVVADELPQIADVWALPIDSKGVVRRNKCRSNVELTSTKTVVRCPDCLQDTTGILYRRCAACHNTRLVEMVYNVQCTIRLAQFTPLNLPARLLLGNRQPHLHYIDTADPRQVRDILHDRAVDALQSAASRVVATHNAKHGSRLLMGRATVTRRGLLTVMVTSFKTKAKRIFDVQDGPDGTVIEVTEQVLPKTKRGTSPAPSSAFREGSFRHNNGSTTSLNSYDRGEDSIKSERGRTPLSPFNKRSEKEERVSSPLSSAAMQAPMIAPIPKRGWKAIFTR